MKVMLNYERDSVALSELECGSCFTPASEENHSVYMKTDEYAPDGDIQCVDLESGTLEGFCENESVLEVVADSALKFNFVV